MLFHHPCCVFVAPKATIGIWGSCIAGSFPCISLESIQLLCFYLEVKALHICFDERAWTVFLRKPYQSGCEQPFSKGADSSLVRVMHLDLGFNLLIPACCPYPRALPHLIVPLKEDTDLELSSYKNQNAAQEICIKLPWKLSVFVVLGADMEVILNYKQNHAK